jgi:hypothetical protein
MRGPEGLIQDKCIAHLRRLKWQVIKIGLCSRGGWPDTYALKDGRHLWIEFKKPGGHPDPLQHVVHEMIRAQNAEVWVIDDIAEFKKMLKLRP